MRIRSFAAAAVAALLVPAAPAFAGDPTMPLSQVQAGMQCTGYSVIQGTDDQLVRRRGARRRRRRGRGASANILFQVSGPAVDATGHRPGLLGLADLLPGRGGRAAG